MHLFLDIDGVLNKESDWNQPFTLNKSCVKEFHQLLHVLNNPTIILSSSWRKGMDNQGRQSDSDKTTILADAGIIVADCTPITKHHTRQEEIEYYIKRNQIKNYLILDDDVHLFPNPERVHLYVTNYQTGLTKADVKRIQKEWKRCF